jgi:hypothetical protein
MEHAEKGEGTCSVATYQFSRKPKGVIGGKSKGKD